MNNSKQIANNIRKVGAIDLPQAIEMAMTNACLVVEGSAKKNAPVDTGNLRNSITHNVSGTEGVIGTNVPYAPYVELGTSRMAPQPYLKPALDSNISAIKKCFEGII